MSINYFNSDTSEVSNSIIEEIEYRVVSGKISKLSNPIGNKIIESTEAGDIKESDVGVESLVERVNSFNEKSEENYRRLNTRKLQKFSTTAPQGKIVVTRDNGGLSYTEISAEALNTRVNDSETKIETLETRADNNAGSVSNLEASVESLQMQTRNMYVSVSAELSGSIDTGDVFKFGSGADGNLHGGYVAMYNGLIKRGSLSCVASNGDTSVAAKVSVCVNGIPSSQKIETRNKNKVVKSFSPPIPIRSGDKILFIADRPVRDAEWSVASVIVYYSMPG